MLIVAEQQTAGKGQRGQSWESDAGLNLLCTWLIEGDGLPASSAIMLNMAVACALCETGERWIGERSKIKWPNDLWCLPNKNSTIQSNKDASEKSSTEKKEGVAPDPGGKWGGILVENQISGAVCRQSAIGFGLNVNQTLFAQHLPMATSLKAQTDQKLNRDEVLELAIQRIQFWLSKIKNKESDKVVAGYVDRLLGLGEYCGFSMEGKKFQARVEGIEPTTGALVLFDGHQTFSGLHPTLRHNMSGPERGRSDRQSSRGHEHSKP